jgi:hypothetical protein
LVKKPQRKHSQFITEITRVKYTVPNSSYHFSHLRSPMPNPLQNAAKIMSKYQPKTNDPNVTPGLPLFKKPIRPLSKREIAYLESRAEKIKAHEE